MKTILYTMVAIFIFGIIATGFTNKANTKNIILIESVNKNVSSTTLNQSVEIITNRLKDYSSKKFEVNAIPGKNQIQVVLYSKWELTEVEKLLTQKGSLGFYETYNQKSLKELLSNDTHFYSLFNNSITKDSATWIGETPITEVEKVNEYLKTSGLDKKCKFAWSLNPVKSNMSLYALKSDKGAILTGSDVESMKLGFDKKHKFNEIRINFKPAAVQIWEDVTKRNIGNAIAIVMDDKVDAAPYVATSIPGGKCIITGNLTKAQIKFIAALGDNGELPIDFKIVK
jgi:preprotein translocase subunit SecD